MSLELRRRIDLTPQQLAELEAAMTAFYRNPASTYYQMADAAWEHYNPKETPFHCDLVGRVVAGASVLELGCGTAPLCPQVEARGGSYTGVDIGEELLEQNQRRFPTAGFHRVGTPLGTTFDIVASLYTIEHVVDPPAYLERMWSYCCPGGLLAIICPEFVDCGPLPPSFLYGSTPRRLREKLRSFSFIDAARHVLDVKVRGPLWKRRAQSSPPGAFWLNLRPRVLHGAEYEIDADAVHLVRCRDLVSFFEDKGAAIVQTSATMTGILPEVLQFNGYVLAQKIVA